MEQLSFFLPHLSNKVTMIFNKYRVDLRCALFILFIHNT